VEQAPAQQKKKRSRKRQLIGGGLAIAIVAGVFAFVLPRIADYRDVWGVVKALSWWEILLLLGTTALNLGTAPPPTMAALPGLRYRQAFVVTQASTASTYIAPGGAAPGIAVSYGMLRGWGFKGPPVTLALALISVWNQLALFGFPIIALALLTTVGEGNRTLEIVALIGLAVFVAVIAGFVVGFRSDSLARRVGDVAARTVSRLLRLVRRGPVSWGGDSFARFRQNTIRLLQRRWHVLTAAVLANQLTTFLVLYATLRVLHVSAGEVSGIEAFASWSLVRVIGSLPLTPGGLGIVELGLTSLLVGFGGDQAEVVAAVLVYRFLTIVPTLVLGLAAGATWKRHNPGAMAEGSPAVD
jgi:putative heme transporter